MSVGDKIKTQPMRVPFTIGVVKMEVEGRDSDHFNEVVAHAVVELEAVFAHEPFLRTHLHHFAGPHLTPGAGNYAPLDLLEIGIAEKLERDLPFLIIVTEVDLSSTAPLRSTRFSVGTDASRNPAS